MGKRRKAEAENTNTNFFYGLVDKDEKAGDAMDVSPPAIRHQYCRSENISGNCGCGTNDQKNIHNLKTSLLISYIIYIPYVHSL